VTTPLANLIMQHLIRAPDEHLMAPAQLLRAAMDAAAAEAHGDAFMKQRVMLQAVSEKVSEKRQHCR
jgi:hypothetical protein